jgi:transcription antitermination factor NusG
MKYTDLQKGDVLPVEFHRGIVGAKLDTARWHALVTPPGKEQAAKAVLAREGVFSFYPTEERTRFFRGEKIVTKHPTITRIIYARFKRQPQWDVLRARRVINGVFCYGTRPIALPYDVIRSLQGLPTRIERLQAAKEALQRLYAGETVQVTEGPLSGFMVDVTQAKDGRVWWQAIMPNGLPIKGESSRDEVQRLGLA